MRTRSKAVALSLSLVVAASGAGAASAQQVGPAGSRLSGTPGQGLGPAGMTRAAAGVDSDDREAGQEGLEPSTSGFGDRRSTS